MARPRIFVSSTYYDLKHIRSSLDNFIEGLGFDSILSEKGDVAYTHDAPLDESCYREVSTADIFVLIVGGRYGSEASSDDKKPDRKFFERYESITKLEYEKAVERDIPVYVLVEASVYSEYRTFLQNKSNDSINYAQVGSVNVFHLIEEILSKPRNNPVHTFERFSDMEAWLREQWAGLFREHLQRASSQQQLATLSGQVETLREVSTTLKKYLEAVMAKMPPEESAKLIQSEEERLEDLRQAKLLEANHWVDFVKSVSCLELQAIRTCLQEAKSFQEFCTIVGDKSGEDGVVDRLYTGLERYPDAPLEFNRAREILGLTAFAWEE